MPRLFLSLSFLCIAYGSTGQAGSGRMASVQGPDSLISGLKGINKAITAHPHSSGREGLVSNRAMNIFLSEKAGYYLSESDNLTLYKNSVVANAAEGTLAIYHNLRQPPESLGADEQVRSFLSIGAKANFADAFAAKYAGRQYSNQFGLLLKQTWMGKVRAASSISQKLTMDALRAGILHSLETEINSRTADFEKALNAMNTDDVPGQSLQAAREIARAKFNADLRAEYEYRFALLQSEALSKGFNYNSIAVGWTSFSLYIPLITEKITTAPDLISSPGVHHAYPLRANITHTWLWESSRSGRFFLSIAGDASLNNSKDGYALKKSDDFYIGNYQQFITPALKGQFVYFPPDSHIGISLLMEQNMGSYNALNGILGIPIVLINKKAIPAVDFEFQVRFFDLSNKIAAVNDLPGKTSIGLSMGIPFSKIAY